MQPHSHVTKLTNFSLKNHIVYSAVLTQSNKEKFQVLDIVSEFVNLYKCNFYLNFYLDINDSNTYKSFHMPVLVFTGYKDLTYFHKYKLIYSY